MLFFQFISVISVVMALPKSHHKSAKLHRKYTKHDENKHNGPGMTEISKNLRYQHKPDNLGCWKIPFYKNVSVFEEDMRLSFGHIMPLKHRDKKHLLTLCVEEATLEQVDTFAVSDHDCWTDIHLPLTFRRYGSSTECHSGVGGKHSMNVYSLKGAIDYVPADDEGKRNLKKNVVMRVEANSKGSMAEHLDHEIPKFMEKERKRGPDVTPGVKKDNLLISKLFDSIYGHGHPISMEQLQQLKEGRTNSELNKGRFLAPSNVQGTVSNSIPTANSEVDVGKVLPGDHVSLHRQQAMMTDSRQLSQGAEQEAISLPNDGNLFSDADFEASFDTSDALSGWSCQGELNDPRGGVFSRITTYVKSGNYAGLCSDRLAEWAGPGQYIGSRLMAGHAYKVEGYTKLLGGNAEEDYTIEMWIRFLSNTGKSETKVLLAKRGKYLRSTEEWQRWRASFYLPHQVGGYKYVYLFFMGPRPKISIAIDNMNLTELSMADKWELIADKRIDSIRKRDAVVKLNFDKTLDASEMNKIKLEVQQVKSFFGFGAAVGHKGFLDDSEYRKVITDNFEWATPESALKWNMIEKRRGDTDYKVVDQFIDEMEKANLTIRGHCALWEVTSELPTWLPSLNQKELTDEIRSRLEDVMERYKGRFAHWDVNNEMLHGSFFADSVDMGPRIRDWIYKRARDIDGKAQLFVNDFDIISSSLFTQSFVELIRSFQDRDVPVDAVGVQGHFTGSVHPAMIQDRLEIVSEIGLPIWITELDILNVDDNRRADSLETVLTLAFSNPAVQGIVLWCTNSKGCWRGKDAALWDDQNQPNETGKRYLQLRAKWTTSLELSPSTLHEKSCEFEFRGFHGTYRFQFTLPNGQKIEETIQLLPKDEPLNVDINAHGKEPVHDNLQRSL